MILRREREGERDLKEMEMESGSPKRRWKKREKKGREQKRSTCLFVTVYPFLSFLKNKLQTKTTELVRPKGMVLYHPFYFN